MGGMMGELSSEQLAQLGIMNQQLMVLGKMPFVQSERSTLLGISDNVVIAISSLDTISCAP